MNPTRYDRALDFAIAAHKGQVRKYTGEPYWMHVARVAEKVSLTEYATMEMVEAALLHDTIEDTKTTSQDLLVSFGPLVANYVVMLTNANFDFGNRVMRKADEVRRLKEAPNEVKTIKLADILDNGPSIGQHDPKFSKRYFVPEKLRLLESLKGGDFGLYQKANDMLVQMSAK